MSACQASSQAFARFALLTTGPFDRSLARLFTRESPLSSLESRNQIVSFSE